MADGTVASPADGPPSTRSVDVSGKVAPGVPAHSGAAAPSPPVARHAAERPTPDELAALVDHAAIERLQRAYADGVTRRAWADVAALFVPDVAIELDLVSRPSQRIEGIDAFIAFVGPAVDRYSFFEFVILNAVVDLWPDGDRDLATARLWMCELRLPAGGTDRDDAYGLYRDTYRRVDGEWRIAHRRYRSLARFPTAEVHPLPTDL